MVDTDMIIEIILIIFFPPVAVWFHAKGCVSHVWINLCLLFLFYIPALIHALWFCFLRDGR